MSFLHHQSYSLFPFILLENFDVKLDSYINNIYLYLNMKNRKEKINIFLLAVIIPIISHFLLTIFEIPSELNAILLFFLYFSLLIFNYCIIYLFWFYFYKAFIKKHVLFKNIFALFIFLIIICLANFAIVRLYLIILLLVGLIIGGGMH